jgi:nicotinamidase/pyrazinamidase
VPEALVVVDLQNDFCPGGALPVADGDAIVPLVNRLLMEAHVRVLTQDWHPPQHRSFAASHAAATPFGRGLVGGVEQVLWPVHCVQGSAGAAFHPGLDTDRADLILRKGVSGELDSYSAFFENDRATSTGLDGYLRSRGVDAVAVVGLALDVCVAATAIDAARLGYRVRVFEAACRPIDRDGSLAAARAAMKEAGVTIERGGVHR